MTNNEMEDAYFGAFPYEFHADLIRLIAGKCKDALADCSVYKPQRARSLYPYVRRTQIDENIETIAAGYPEISTYLTKLGANNWITEMTHEFVLLTVHKVPTRNSPVRRALQRDMLAQSSQANFLETRKLPPEGAILYSQMKYGVASRFPDRLAFTVVDFPDKHSNIVHSINLLAMSEFASIPEEAWRPIRTEHIDDTLDLNLRSDARNKNKKSGTADNSNNKKDEDTDDEEKGE